MAVVPTFDQALRGAAHGDRIVVVGGGPTGIRFAERVCRLGTRLPVLVLGDEPWQPYDRARLSSLVARELAPDALYDEVGWQERITVLSGRRVVRIDRVAKCVFDERGDAYRYATLVLATGSRPRVPPIPGVETPRVYLFRSMSDAQRLLARQIASRSTVVIGGGLLGLEAARAMRRFNTRVHVVEHEPRLMFRQLDAEAARALRSHVESLGIAVHVGEAVQQIVGPHAVQGVRLKSGTEIACDTVVIAAGIVPNVELARDTGIVVDRGIRVDDRMRTSDPDVYAVGECCEHRGRVYGLIGPGLEQAGVAASNIVGQPAQYLGSIVATSLKVVGCAVFSMGEIESPARTFDSFVYKRGGRYRRINVYRGRLVGAVGFGEWDVARLRAAGLEQRRLWPWQLWRFRRNGSLWSEARGMQVGRWPAGATVCVCRSVPRAALDAAIHGGAASVAALGSATGAGTVCGSCKPLLAELIGGVGTTAPLPWKLLGASVFALGSATAAFFVALPYAATMSMARRWDVVWTDAFYKQMSGYSLLAIALLAAALSLRKRVPRFRWASFPTWRVVHAFTGVLAVLALLGHTGFRPGDNLNAWLMACFTGLLLSGGLAGVAVALAERRSTGSVETVRTIALWTHVLLLWPLPALVGFHVLKGYYF